LVKLVEIRASQINGCAICLDMHTREAREAGETPERIWMLGAWRESRLYSERDKAALGWTDALTRLSETRAPDADYDAMAAQFSEADQVKLTMLIGVINSFNKLGVGFRVRPPTGAARKAA
jgi:AhpD family alkylhydroperoxidase